MRQSRFPCRRAVALALALASTAVAAAGEPGAGFVPFGASFASVLELPAPAPDRVESYGAAPEQRREIWLHAGGAPRPLVVLVHGGCWLNAYGVEHARPLAAALRDAGYVVVAPEYRRVGDAGGGWRGSLDDVEAALAGLAGRGTQLGFDPSRVAVVGHSAGGHLALLAALELVGAEGIAPSLVVGLAAITDPEAYAGGSGSCHAATPRMFGGMPDEVPEAYRDGSPVRRLLAGAPTPPVLLLQGGADPIVAPEQAAKLAEASRAVALELLPGAGHFDLIHPRSAAFPRLLGMLARGLRP